ncbi:hypothetical protein [Agromyces sp. Marseille-P2726]|uniref:hypothetical protein n=1 Tax=Agromyces sp. Marseille-P2726 TaxID=2709132 RepID=UPI00157054C5|nr:hypothetical protein [Agromyces sp. Marseille-P2726]
MSTVTGITKTMTVTGLAVAAVYGATRVALRARRAWRNMKIIQSVDTGSVWTTE